jgi:basic membrane lipoprotein Med (substrate-binding protein (PBP1-ABC) superfamily)
MNKIRFSLAATILTSLVIGLSACAPAPVEEPDHKARTTACLIRSSSVVPGTPENQLAADLVEAKVVYGLAVREVKIDDNTEDVPTRLLQALQAGCVLMVSANSSYLSDLAEFAVAHPRMIVLFVGDNIASSSQPANFRWVADDIQSGSRLAGYFAASKSTTGSVYLFVQPTFASAQGIRTSFIQGVNDFVTASGSKVQTVYIRTPNSKTLKTKLDGLEPVEVASIFAGKSIWQSIDPEQPGGPFLIGADLQLGNTVSALESRVQVSVERNTSKYVLNAVSSLLDREFTSQPLYRKPGALKFNSVELRITQPDSIDGDLLESLNAYRQELITSSNR